MPVLLPEPAGSLAPSLLGAIEAAAYSVVLPSGEPTGVKVFEWKWAVHVFRPGGFEVPFPAAVSHSKTDLWMLLICPICSGCYCKTEPASSDNLIGGDADFVC
ncbi:hypothetical protein BaRGS_00031978 [Batillaria attramentaria]|uniref:Uncharacterized protein n=1 Tax=Batillaria attramentaria TaxID=370345 RepID=A0ABD0JP17_9CAEN